MKFIGFWFFFFQKVFLQKKLILDPPTVRQRSEPLSGGNYIIQSLLIGQALVISINHIAKVNL